MNSDDEGWIVCRREVKAPAANPETTESCKNKQQCGSDSAMRMKTRSCKNKQQGGSDSAMRMKTRSCKPMPIVLQKDDAWYNPMPIVKSCPISFYCECGGETKCLLGLKRREPRRWDSYSLGPGTVCKWKD
jgi:hypothetical protein